MFESRSEILEVLRMPAEDYRREIMPAARQAHQIHNGGGLTAAGMIGYSNICRSRCLYCGMRAGSVIPRYRLPADDVIAAARTVSELGLPRLFLISGEDPGYPFADLLKIVAAAKEYGLWVSLAAGELEREQYAALRDVGLDEYALKFEMSDREVFNRLNPSTDFDRRMRCIVWIKECGLALGSGNIVGYPGHTLGQVADDILLMRELEIRWAPVIPYMPAKGTPLAEEGGPGSLDTTLREISLLRLMMPEIRITAQQPGKNPADGLTADDGNLEALTAGADLLFVDMLPSALAKAFRVVDERLVRGMEHVRTMAQAAGMPLRLMRG